jgi:hypothetical protein
MVGNIKWVETNLAFFGESKIFLPGLHELTPFLRSAQDFPSLLAQRGGRLR